VGFQQKFPAFYSRESGLKNSLKLNAPEEIVEFARAHWDMGFKSAILVTNPVPKADAVPKAEMDPIIARASRGRKRSAQARPLPPPAINELTPGKSLNATLPAE
jgi:pseudouridine-5'-phosphate glycosidase